MNPGVAYDDRGLALELVVDAGATSCTTSLQRGCLQVSETPYNTSDSGPSGHRFDAAGSACDWHVKGPPFRPLNPAVD